MERLYPQHPHDAVVAWHEEKGIIVVCLREPLQDVVKAKPIDYPLNRSPEVTRALELVIGSRALAFCQAVLSHDRTTVASILVTPHHFEVTLAPLARVEDVYDEVVECISPCLFIAEKDIYDLRKCLLAQEELKELCNTVFVKPTHWEPVTKPVRLWRERRSLLGEPLIGRCLKVVTLQRDKLPNGFSLKRNKPSFRGDAYLYFTTEEELEQIKSDIEWHYEKAHNEWEASRARYAELQAYIDAY